MVVTPKTASSSMNVGVLDHRFVKRRTGGKKTQAIRRGHACADIKWDLFYNNMYSHRLDEVFKFTFVRNPWDRLLSAFTYKIRRGTLESDADFNDYMLDVYRDWPEVDDHFFTQSRNYLFEGVQFIDFIGKFENLKEDWAYVAKKIDENPNLPRYNTTKHAHYSTYYNDKSIEIVGNLYKEEIKHFGYEFTWK